MFLELAHRAAASLIGAFTLALGFWLAAGLLGELARFALGPRASLRRWGRLASRVARALLRNAAREAPTLAALALLFAALLAGEWLVLRAEEWAARWLA